MMRLRHHICFVGRLLYQAFEFRHDWSLINSFHSLDLTILVNLAFAYSENLGSHLLLGFEEWFHVSLFSRWANQKKSSTKTTHMSLHWDVEMMFPTPHERGAIALSPSQMYRWLLRFTEDSVQHFKVKNNRFCLSLLLSIFPKTKHTWGDLKCEHKTWARKID